MAEVTGIVAGAGLFKHRHKVERSNWKWAKAIISQVPPAPATPGPNLLQHSAPAETAPDQK